MYTEKTTETNGANEIRDSFARRQIRRLKGKANKTQAGKNNYTFNNCTVTINEEGKAIDILQKKEAVNNMVIESGIKLAGNIIDIFTKRNESVVKKEPTSGPTREAFEELVAKPTTNKQKSTAKKKSPVKKRKR
ncbi:MAG: hypothetical protein V4547_18085 [Bacteroidota bacterium]